MYATLQRGLSTQAEDHWTKGMYKGLAALLKEMRARR